jgi:uncharacterized protein YaaR (DUF327 family)
VARKSKGFTELLQLKRDAQLEKIGMDNLQKKVKESGEDIKLIQNPESEEKMSEVLEEFVKPYLEFSDNHVARKELFSTAVAAWNLALLPDDKRSACLTEMIESSVDKIDKLTQQNLREIFNEMVARKLDLFPNNKRIIYNFQLQESKNKFYLSVASSLIEPPDAAK